MCIHCGEKIGLGDAYQIVPAYPSGPHGSEVRYHRECWVRAIVGSVAHLERRCSCFVPGSTETDPPDLTKRQAAQLVANRFAPGWHAKRT